MSLHFLSKEMQRMWKRLDREEVNLSALRNEFDSLIPTLVAAGPKTDTRDLPTDVQEAVNSVWGTSPLAGTIARAGARKLMQSVDKDTPTARIAEIVRNHGVTIE